MGTQVRPTAGPSPSQGTSSSQTRTSSNGCYSWTTPKTTQAPFKEPDAENKEAVNKYNKLKKAHKDLLKIKADYEAKMDALFRKDYAYNKWQGKVYDNVNASLKCNGVIYNQLVKIVRTMESDIEKIETEMRNTK